MTSEAEHRLLVLGPAVRAGGILVYCREVLPRIVAGWPGPVTLALNPVALSTLPDDLGDGVELLAMERPTFARGPLHLIPSMLHSLRIVRTCRPHMVLSIGNIAYAGPRTRTVALLDNAARVRDLQHAGLPFYTYVILLRLGYRLTALRATRAIAVSQHMRDVAPSSLSRKGTAVVHHGVAVPPPDASPARGSALRILLPGSVVPYRGLERVIRSLAPHPEWDLRIIVAGPVGSVRYRRHIGRLLESTGLGERVEWCGAISRDDMLEQMRSATHVVLSSRVEACPGTLLEAAAVDPTRPIITFDDAWSHEYADLIDVRTSESGLLAAIRRTSAGSDPDAVALRIRALEDFTWDRCAQQTLAVLQSA